jgi:hypothetical protein
MFMMTPLDQFVSRTRPHGGVWLAVHFNKEVGLSQPISRLLNRRHFQQLIVWRAAQPRSQLIKVPCVRHTDEQLRRRTPQETI